MIAIVHTDPEGGENLSIYVGMFQHDFLANTTFLCDVRFLLNWSKAIISFGDIFEGDNMKKKNTDNGCGKMCGEIDSEVFFGAQSGKPCEANPEDNLSLQNFDAVFLAPKTAWVWHMRRWWPQWRRH